MHVLASLGFCGWCRSDAGVAFPLPVVWPCPLVRRRESSLHVVVAGAHPMVTAAPSIGRGPPEARPRPYLRPLRCALLLYHWGPRLPSFNLGGWRIFSSRALPCQWNEPFFSIGLFAFPFFFLLVAWGCPSLGFPGRLAPGLGPSCFKA